MSASDWIVQLQGGPGVEPPAAAMQSAYISIKWMLHTKDFDGIDGLLWNLEVGLMSPVAITGILRYSAVGKAEIHAWRSG